MRFQEAQDRDRSRSSTNTPGQASTDLRRQVSRLGLSSRLSALKTQSLSAAVTAAGGSGVADIARCGRSGENAGSIHRDLMRLLLRESTVPEPYWAEVPTHDPKTGEDGVMVRLPCLLVHEVLAAMWTRGSESRRRMTSAVPFVDALRQDFCRKGGLDADGVVPIGFHGDGVPHQHGRSVQVFSWNILSYEATERMLFCVIAKELCCKCGCLGRHTLDAITEVFAWSMRHLLVGEWPTCRHDGTPWARDDKSRAKLTGDMGVRALLLQARGDWSWLKELFGIPSWSSEQICWLCEADTGDEGYKDFRLSAKWRTARRKPHEIVDLLQANGTPLNPLLSCPGFSVSLIVIDMLHACDLGVSQIALGNLFYEVLPKLGPNRKEQIKQLWERIKTYYQEHKPSSQIQTLTAPMILRTGKGPRLRTKGGETRGLIHFADRLAKWNHEEEQTPRSQTIAATFSRLLDVYHCVAATEYDPGTAASACRQFLLLYKSLGTPGSLLWEIKPKFHMMQELFEFQAPALQSSPSDFWCYKDEDYVGWIATFAGSKGGANNAASAAARTISRYRAWVHEL